MCESEVITCVSKVCVCECEGDHQCEQGVCVRVNVITSVSKVRV